jgi:hypothetical protein
MFGRRAVLPVDISKKPLEQPEMEEFDDNQIDLVMEALKRLRKPIEAVQRKLHDDWVKNKRRGSSAIHCTNHKLKIYCCIVTVH